MEIAGAAKIASATLLALLAIAATQSLVPIWAAAQENPAVQPKLPPPSSRVGAIRRNAQGAIELVAPTDPAPAENQPVAPRAQTPDPAPRAQPSVTQPTPRVPAPGRAPLVQIADPTTEASCAAETILCLRVASRVDTVQMQVPLTFGHPLAPKLLLPDQRLVASINGEQLPVQIDQIARHRDGSVRFGIFSLVLPQLAARSSATLQIARQSQDAPAATPRATATAVPLDVRVELETYSPQITRITFGNRDGNTPGISFKRGETITLELGSDPVERFSLTATAEMEGGGIEGNTKIAEAFAQIVAKSLIFRSYRDVPGAYEKIWITTRDQPGKPFPARVVYAGTAKTTIEVINKWEQRQRYSATLDSARAGGGASARTASWLKGPIATEDTSAVALRRDGDGTEHPYLSAIIAARNYAGTDRARAELTIENTSAFAEAARNLFYDVVVRVNGEARLQTKAVLHTHHARWHREFWVGTMPQVVLTHDRARLLDSRAIPFYDPALRIPDGVIAAEWANLERSDTGLMGAAVVTKYMPNTGSRPDIGPLPRWAALHALSLDERMRRILLAVGDASGTVPVHYRDARTGLPLNVKQHPKVLVPHHWFTGDGTLPKFGWSENQFYIDQAHQPSLAYYPYLLTGERFYLDELQFWASWNATTLPPDRRNDGQGLLYRTEQVRGQAWALRTLAHAALITADAHPLKEAFNEQLLANIEWYRRSYVGQAGADSGALPGWIGGLGNLEEVAPWQQDFVAIVLTYMAENDVPGAKPLLQWLSRFVVGRWMAENKGYCRAAAPAYWLKVANSGTGKKVQSWAELFKANWPQQGSCATMPLQSSPTCTDCYLNIARASLAALLNVGFEEAREPYEYIRLLPDSRNAPFYESPTFAIVPRPR